MRSRAMALILCEDAETTLPDGTRPGPCHIYGRCSNLNDCEPKGRCEHGISPPPHPQAGVEGSRSRHRTSTEVPMPDPSPPPVDAEPAHWDYAPTPDRLAEMAEHITEAIRHHREYRELDEEILAETARRLRLMAVAMMPSPRSGPLLGVGERHSGEVDSHRVTCDDTVTP